jgi:hypothetical protein
MKQDIQQIIDNHELWLKTNHAEGERADLSDADLSYADLIFETIKLSPTTGTVSEH